MWRTIAGEAGKLLHRSRSVAQVSQQDDQMLHGNQRFVELPRRRTGFASQLVQPRFRILMQLVQREQPHVPRAAHRTTFRSVPRHEEWSSRYLQVLASRAIAYARQYCHSCVAQQRMRFQQHSQPVCSKETHACMHQSCQIHQHSFSMYRALLRCHLWKQ